LIVCSKVFLSRLVRFVRASRFVLEKCSGSVVHEIFASGACDGASADVEPASGVSASWMRLAGDPAPAQWPASDLSSGLC